MISQHSTATLGRLKQGTGRWRWVTGGALLTVAVVGAIGVWQVREQAGGRTSTSKTATPPSVAVEQSTGAQPVASTPTFYLVGSQAEAEALRASVAQLGTPLLPEVVMVATTADGDAFLQAMREQDGMHTGRGLASVTVIDLRLPATTATPLDPLARELEALSAAR